MRWAWIGASFVAVLALGLQTDVIGVPWLMYVLFALAGTSQPTSGGGGPRRHRLRRVAIDPRVDIGHVHLKVADLDRALAFYRDVLGFELSTRYGDQAAFLSAGGYHHHIGLNTWESEGGSPPPRGPTGLYHVAIRYPDRRTLADALKRVCSTPASRRRRERPRRQRGDLPARLRRQRRRALPRPAARGVAAARRRRRRHRDDTQPLDLRRAARRARGLMLDARAARVHAIGGTPQVDEIDAPATTAGRRGRGRRRSIRSTSRSRTAASTAGRPSSRT